MPFQLDAHVLTVDTNLLHKVDTSNPHNLHGMWTVFARCAESLEQGRRLENISWRLWNRETFCCATQQKTSCSATSLPRYIPQDARIPQDVPELSSSSSSSADEEAIDFTSEESGVDFVRPWIRRQDSCTSNRSRGRERHITSDDFEKIVSSIIKEKEPLSAPLPSIAAPYMAPQKEEWHSMPAFERSGSTTTESPCKSSVDEEAPSQQPSSPERHSRTTVVRGFSPSNASIPRTITESPRSVPAALPEPQSEPAPKIVLPKKQPAFFFVGGSASSSELDQSPNAATRPAPPQQPKRKTFSLGVSSEEDNSIKSALASPRINGALSPPKKQASFSDQVVTLSIDNDTAVGDDSDTDYVDESAIDDDDDSSDWEDSIEDSGKSSMDDRTMFQRVDSKANLTSRRSLITLMLAQNGRAAKLGNAASQSTSAIPRTRLAQGQSQGQGFGGSPNDSDEAPLMMRGLRPSPLKPINEVPRSTARPIAAAATQNHLQAALSPRTTRRNMLSTELTESLRRNLLLERQQRTSTANAVLKRRHTSHDVANLKQYPEKAYMTHAEDANPNNQYFQKETFGGYHSKGW